MKKLLVTIRSSLILKIRHKYPKTLQIFTNIYKPIYKIYKHKLFKRFSKMPTYEIFHVIHHTIEKHVSDINAGKKHS